jgi:hypothetical protein
MQRLGKAFIKVDGKLLETMPGAKLNVGGVKRAPVNGANAVLGFSEEIVNSMVECEISVSKDTKPLDYSKMADVSITFECDTGQTFVCKNAFLTEPPELTAQEGGKVPLKFAGAPADQVN